MAMLRAATATGWCGDGEMAAVVRVEEVRASGEGEGWRAAVEGGDGDGGDGG